MPEESNLRESGDPDHDSRQEKSWPRVRQGTSQARQIVGREDDSEQARQKESFRKWQTFLDSIEPGQGRDAVEKLLTGNYRDKCTIVRGGSGSHTDVYLLDDFHELHFHFDVIRGLVSQSIHKKTLWLRYPNGHVARIKEAR